MESLLKLLESEENTFIHVKKHFFGALTAPDLLRLSLVSRWTRSLPVLRLAVVTSRVREFAPEKFLENHFLDLFGGM
jgi:hypothetical protein